MVQSREAFTYYIELGLDYSEDEGQLTTRSYPFLQYEMMTAKK